MIKAIFDINGLPVAFYDTDINKNIPANAIEITKKQHIEFINNQGKRKYENGKVVIFDIVRTVEVAYREAMYRLHEGYEAELNSIKIKYSQSERDGWAMQITSAHEHIASNPSPLIDELATTRGITPSDMASKVLTKLNEYQLVYAAATGKIGALRDQADAALLADDIATLDAITW